PTGFAKWKIDHWFEWFFIQLGGGLLLFLLALGLAVLIYCGCETKWSPLRWYGAMCCRRCCRKIRHPTRPCCTPPDTEGTEGTPISKQPAPGKKPSTSTNPPPSSGAVVGAKPSPLKSPTAVAIAAAQTDAAAKGTKPPTVPPHMNAAQQAAAIEAGLERERKDDETVDDAKSDWGKTQPAGGQSSAQSVVDQTGTTP
ncbi:hypothetical protein PENTCL1PPCAC_3587, partial [Pristionchus entomophagus]